jgi:hypothetical protein
VTPERLEKLAAAIMVAASAALLYLALTRLTDPTWALVLGLVYGFCTSSFSISSQALWQHTGGQLTLAAGLYAVLRGRKESWWAGVTGLPLGVAVICRPTNAIIVALVALYALVGMKAWRLAAWTLPPFAFQLWYNWTYFGHPFHTQFALTDTALWSTPLLQGLAGLLLSPGRGLLVYSPIFVLSIVGAAIAWRRGGDPLLRALSVGIALTVVVYARWVSWWGGGSYGPRLLADLTPALTLLLCPLRPWLRRPWARVVFVGLVAWSVFAHGLGAFRDDGRWNAYPSVDRFPERLWLWTDNPLVNALTDASGRARAALGLLPTSRTSEALVRASGEIGPEPSDSMAPGEAFSLVLRVTNDGEALWLSEGRAGRIMIGWRWVPSAEAPGPLTLIPLRHDVASGRSYELPLILATPQKLGAYSLEIGLVRLVNGRTDWVVTTPSPPFRFRVEVDPTTPGIVAWLPGAGAALRGSADDDRVSPRVATRLDASRFEAGSPIALALEVATPQGGPARDLYVGVLLPDRRTALFFRRDGRLTSVGFLTDHRQFVPLATTEPGFSLRASPFFQDTIPVGAPPGRYELFVILTAHGALRKPHPSADDIVLLQTTNFEVLP